MSADIDTVRQAIVAAVRESLGSHVTVESHGGRFDRQELARYSKRAPAVLIAAMSVAEVIDDARPTRAGVQWAAFIVTRDAPGAARDTQALILAESLVRQIPGNTWGVDSTQRPGRITGENLYSGEIDRLGIAMWAVSWRQQVRLQPLRDIRDLADFALYSGTHRIGDGPDTESYLELPVGSDNQE